MDLTRTLSPNPAERYRRITLGGNEHPAVRDRAFHPVHTRLQGLAPVQVADLVTAGMFPSPLTITPPTTSGGKLNPQTQFLTDNPATNNRCTAAHTDNCVVPPPRAPGHFYPYWT